MNRVTPIARFAPTLGRRLAGMTLALVLSLNCAGLDIRAQPDPGTSRLAPGEPGYDEVIQVQYLGTGGHLISKGGYGILTAPLYSNPGILRVGLACISPDTNLIRRLHPKEAGIKVGAILVGHSHYDHLLDVPFVARSLHPEATVYGNTSTKRLLLAADSSLTERVRVLHCELSREGRPGDWIYLADSALRFMAIESDHGSHTVGIHVMQGEITAGLKRVPRSAWNWREGKTFAYLIDFLGPGGKIDFRIHYQDATSHYPLGAPPDFAPRDSHRVDLAIVTVGSWGEVPDYPGALLRHHRPRHVILGHWENFFRSPLKPPRPIIFSTRFRAFIPYIEANLPPDADWLLPMPGDVYRFRPTGLAKR